MDTLMLQKAIETTGIMLHSFYCRCDIEETLSFVAEDAIWIGPGEGEMQTSKAAIRAYCELGKDNVPYCDIINESYNTADYGTCCMVYGSLTIRSKEESKLIVEVNQRFSILFSEVSAKLLVKHMHISNSCEEMEREAFFPRQIGVKNYRYLQQVLKEKTDVIEMITSNINGGLKSSNDDEIYSHFYVNAGLPKMLGYNYDEFMEKTNYCTVDAIYPPDLPKVLASVGKQLENNAFSVEYRMKKKDGSLIWVMDSGRKSKDGNGGYKINSILMDITPLKTALYELELERGRYRIALENITDVMFEYDIENDMYTTYQRIEIDEKVELEKYEIPEFSKSFWTKSIVHPSDCEIFLDVLRAENRTAIEIRTRSMQAKGEWRYAKISCSVIYNVNRQPIRTIGTMKDITEEKTNENILINRIHQDTLTRLYNQMTAKKYIEQYLSLKDIHSQSALLIVNLDDFKLVNDNKGSLFGNELLVATSQVLKENVRVEDIVGRISGDDFIILLKQANREAASLCALRIINKVSTICDKHTEGITCSIGIAITSEARENYDSLLRMADRALYTAKTRGKNQYVICDEA